MLKFALDHLAGKRFANSVLTVSLESQARTLEEQRRMDAGDMEERYIDTLWLFTASAPANTKGGAPVSDASDVKRMFLYSVTHRSIFVFQGRSPILSPDAGSAR